MCRIYSTVRGGREEPGCPWSHAAVLRSASWQPGVRGHLAPARLPQRLEQRHTGAGAQREPPQRQSQHQQQQRPVRAEPQHQHHVGAGGQPRRLKPPVTAPETTSLFPVDAPVFNPVTLKQNQWNDLSRVVSSPLLHTHGHFGFRNCKCIEFICNYFFIWFV